MAQEPEHKVVPPQAGIKKACQISLCFPCDDDQKALDIKKAIDGVVGDVPGKRYTFNITEM